MSPPQTPQLSVVIPSYNRRDLLQRCLDSLAGQTQDPDTFEVVVADDGSSDGTAEMAEGLETPFHLKVLKLENGGWAAALNAGARASRGTICLHLDDDVVASPQLVAEHIAAHKDGGHLTGVGKLVQQPPEATDWYAHACARGLTEHYEDLVHRPADWTDCYGANLSAPRSVLIESGGFAMDIPAAVDLELGFRLSRAGYPPRYIPGAKGVHDDQKLVPQMLRDARSQGVAHLQVAERHPATLPQLLDWVNAAGPKELALRRFLIAIRVPPSVLAPIGRFLPGVGRKMVWLHFVRRFAFWLSVRQNVGRDRWRELTGPGATDRIGASPGPSIP